MDLKRLQSSALILVVCILVGSTIYDKFASGRSPLDFRHNSDVYDVEVPSKFDFCGEPVPLHDSDVKERFDRELLVNAHFHSNTLLMIKRSHRWFPVIEKILKEEGIPDDFKYLMAIESSLTNSVSPAGAAGFWQFMKETGKELGLEINDQVDERYHPVKSTRAACKYIKEAYRKFGSWTNVAASYNAGIAGMSRVFEKQKAASYYDLLLNSETGRYVYRLLAVKEIMQHPEKYRMKVANQHLYSAEKVKLVEVDTSINSLVDFAISQGVSYKALKLYNPWLISDKLIITEKSKKYTFEIPLDMPFEAATLPGMPMESPEIEVRLDSAGDLSAPDAEGFKK